MTQQLVCRETGFYLLGWNLRRERVYFCPEPCSPVRSSTSLASQNAKSRNQTLCPYVCLSWRCKQISVLSGKYTCGLQSPSYHSISPLQDLSSVSTYSPRIHVPCSTGSLWSPRRAQAPIVRERTSLSVRSGSQESEFCKAEFLMASKSARVSLIRAAACCSLPDYTRSPGRILTTNCLPATS